jgi:hypothetical protein
MYICHDSFVGCTSGVHHHVEKQQITHLYGPSPTKAILTPGSLSITLYLTKVNKSCITVFMYQRIKEPANN